MAGEAIAGAFNTAAGIFQTEQNRNFQREMWDNQKAYGTAEANKQRLWEEGMYQRYHSPAAQIRQIKEAGLSPALLYAQGLGSGSGVFHGGGPNTPSVGAPQSYAGMMQGENIADIAMARKTNAEADILEEYGGKEKEAEIALKNAKKSATESEVVLNNALANQADKQAEWQEWQTKITKIQENIASATKEDAIKLVHENVRNVASATDWYYQQISESKKRETEIEELAKYWHAQTFIAFGEALRLSYENQITENTINELTQMATESLRKVAADAENAEKLQERFEEEMRVRIKEAKLKLTGDVIQTVGGVVGTLGASGIKGAALKSLNTGKNIGTFTQTTTTKAANKTITQTTRRPIQWGGYGTYNGYGRF